MNDDKEIDSIKIAARKRTYFLDVKQTCKGAKYLKICESKRIDKGEFDRHGIMIFEEDLYKIVEALKVVLKYFPVGKNPDTKSKMEQTKAKFVNAYKPWTSEEDLKLTKFFYQGKNPKEISEILQRNIGAVNSRIVKLELNQKNGQ